MKSFALDFMLFDAAGGNLRQAVWIEENKSFSEVLLWVKMKRHLIMKQLADDE